MELGTGYSHLEWGNTDLERQTLQAFKYIYILAFMYVCFNENIHRD